MTSLQTAARNIILRWDSPNWKDQAHTAEYVNALRVALEAEQAQAVEPMPTPIRRDRTAQEFHFGMLVLNWNRAQQTPPIDIGRELWVADEMVKLHIFNVYPPNKAAPMTMTEIVEVAGSQHIDVYAASFMCGIRAAEKHYGITQGEKP